jgi:hypothetical protein
MFNFNFKIKNNKLNLKIKHFYFFSENGTPQYRASKTAVNTSKKKFRTPFNARNFS